MLTREQCIKAAESLSHGKDIDRRNAARSLADYCRIILNNIGSHYPGYTVIRHISIKHRYGLLQALVPQLITFKKLFVDIQDLRDTIDHNDEEIPSTNELINLIEDTKKLDQIFNEEIKQDLGKLDLSPYERLLEDWREVFYLYDRLDNYFFEDKKKLEDVVNRVHKYQKMISKFQELNDQTKTDIDRELLKLQIDLRKLLEERRRS